MPGHVFFCHCLDQTVWLNLQSDKYYLVDNSDFERLSCRVDGLTKPLVCSAATSTACDDDLSDVENFLLLRGLIVGADTSGHGRTVGLRSERTILGPVSLDANPEPAPIAPSVSSTLNFTRSFIASKSWKKRLPLMSIVTRMAALKAKLLVSKDVCDGGSSRLEQSISRFRLLRCFAYTAQQNCLFDSMVLLQFLWREHISADWIFGVRTRPFAAHCWAQANDLVLNDSHRHVSQYTPIMVL